MSAEAQTGLRIELHQGNKRSVFEIDDDRALIGSGAHCDVRLGPDEAANEHLSIQVIDDDIYVEAKALNPVCTLNGAPFLEGRVIDTSVLELGGVALRVLRSAGERRVGIGQGQRKSATSPLVQVLGLVGIGVGLYSVLTHPDLGDSAVNRTVNPPPLAAVKPEPCATRDPREARALAEQAEIEADSQRERSPFYQPAALGALNLFERAAGCYEAARDTQSAEDALKAAEELRTRVSDDVHIRHVRLGRFISRKDYAAVNHEATLLAGLIDDKVGPYGRWLSAVRRESELADKGKGKGRK